MKRFLALFLFATLFFQSCDDGDIIVTTFNFDDAPLKECGTVGNYVFYKLNPDAKESLSLKLAVTDSLYKEEGIAEYALNGTSFFMNYRNYDAPLGTDYFCSSIPPTTPAVTVDYLAQSGDVFVTTTFIYDDNDGVPEEFEADGDTDGDGIPDIYDADDDGDNVPTIRELNNEDDDDDPTTNPKDTDGDGIPDFLDNDDDDDGVLTRKEDKNMNLDPTDDKTEPTVGADYLNSAISDTYEVNQYRLHEYTIKKNVQITVKDLVLISGDEQIIIESLDMGTIESVEVINKEVTPEL
ncbi:hypothetical protein [Aequorivita marina]|uniref:hypothetical protein n=1 Tax=Aequorivita marina TaxID=3073654 RepID=UPI002876EAF8|nr:hypothetical protein [Aequorivita sp. S2608]MDS1297525.1 hypothetical protein [Aequorivita sp. S2608]